MKTVNRLLGILLGTAALLFSCTKQENPVRQEGNTFEMTIVAGSDQTRTVLGSDGAVTWSASGEQLAVMEAAVSGTKTTTAKKESNVGVPSNNGATMTFGVSLSAKTADSFDYYALYPNSAYVETPSDFAKVKVDLASTQAPTESSFGPSADVLVAKPVTGLTAQPTELNLKFARVIAVGKMTIKNLNTTENVKKVTFTAANKAVTGRSYIDFTTAAGVEYGYSGNGVDNVVLDYSDKTIAAKGMTAVFTCWPFELAAGESFSVVVETENYTFTKKITLAEGKSLAFKVGRASAFNVNFTGIEGIEKAPATQLVKDGAYVVAYKTNMMTVGASSNKYRDVATLPAKANEDGSYSVDATAAWNFVYDAATDTYKINSASDNALYIQGSSTGSDFKLVAEKDATSFSITKKDDGTFKIGITSGSNTRYIGYNTQSPRFAMYVGSTSQPVDLNLYPAKFAIIPKITVQKTLEVPSADTESSFPVTLTNVETAEVTVYKDAACTTEETEWITADFNADKTAVEYVVMENTGEARTAYIKIYALSPDANESSAIITVTQAAADVMVSFPFSQPFNESQGNFTIDNVSLPSELTYVWQHSTYNNEGYMKASAFKSSTNYAAESWLISPVVDMSTATNPVLSFMNVARFGSNDNLTLWAREKGGDWVKLSFSNYGSGNDWTFVNNTIDVSAYAGKTLQFAFKYVSTTGGASTWEIKKIEVKEAVASTKLDAPVVTCTAQTENSLTFSWDAVDNATSYKVSTDGGKTYGLTQTETSYIWKDLTASTTKTLYVKAIGDGTSYTDSDAASASGTTTAASTGGDPTEQTVFLETFGSASSNTAVASYTGYSATADMFTTSGDVKTHYSGDGSVGKSKLSSSNLSSGYTGASGNSGCYHVGTANTEGTILQISNIDITDCTNISISFGALGGSTSHKINVFYKIDDGAETALITNGALTNANWTLLSGKVSETGKSLTLIFKHTPTKAWTIRMDDIKVVGTK